ncbi:MAG TPA: hypothetical protein PK014_13460 [Thermoanaerobaculia bacterium]|nr:hypothetical protein [Thermoanaerobaculia bacterium]HUM31085.1 hypothetical protein [Thermoanaerobaculia bacterium]HXK69403.1 hypothetical protein [Thermoanaerobaculia bacterium]
MTHLTSPGFRTPSPLLFSLSVSLFLMVPPFLFLVSCSTAMQPVSTSSPSIEIPTGDLALALTSENEATAIEAVRRLKDPALLARIAWESNWKSARTEAIAILDDPDELARLALEGDWFLRWMTVPRLTDQEVLARMARSDPEAFIREDAVKQVTNETVLRDVLASDTDQRVRQAAVFSMRDQPFLASLAVESPDEEIRQVAMGGLQDKDLLLRVARETTEEEMRRQALLKVNDPDTCKLLIRTEANLPLRKTALLFISDESVLESLAFDPAENQEIRVASISRLKGEESLARLAELDQPSPVRKAAVEIMKDQDVLSRIAVGDPDREIRLAAIGRLNIQDTLEKLSADEPDPELRARAVSRLESQDVLVHVFHNDPEGAVRLEAIARIHDGEVKADALNDPDERVRAKAVLSMPEDRERFASLALHDPSHLVRMNAAARLLDPEILDRIVRTDPSTGVRETALKRLTDPEYLAAYLENGKDWRLRAETVIKLRDLSVLEKAARDSDEDVRHMAWYRIHHLKLEDQLKDEGLRDKIFHYNLYPVPDPDPRENRLRTELNNPVLLGALGPLEITVTRSYSERRYVRDYEGGGYPPMRGRTIAEAWKVKIKDQKGQILSDRIFRGNKPTKAQAFDKRTPMVDGSYVQYNNAQVDFVLICRDLLKDLGKPILEQLVSDGGRDLRYAAESLLNP